MPTTRPSATDLLDRTREALASAVDDAHTTWSDLSDLGAPADERDLARAVLLAALDAKTAFMRTMGLDS